LGDGARHRVERKIEELIALLQEPYRHTQERAQQEVNRFIDEALDAARQTTRIAVSQAREALHDHYWQTTLGALGLGFLLGLLVRPSPSQESVAAET
jgi:ElaB/YqjD/DUF883 family membrane-anchored ribosome-binding protein